MTVRKSPAFWLLVTLIVEGSVFFFLAAWFQARSSDEHTAVSSVLFVAPQLLSVAAFLGLFWSVFAHRRRRAIFGAITFTIGSALALLPCWLNEATSLPHLLAAGFCLASSPKPAALLLVGGAALVFPGERTPRGQEDE